MFRSIRDWTLPPSSSNVITFDSLLDLFDPRKNVIPTQFMDSVTETQWHNALKTIWCLDNILENWDAFFFTRFPRTEHTEAMVRRIPQDMLYLLHYCMFYAIDGANRIQYTPSWPLNQHLANGNRAVEYSCYYNSASRASYSLRTSNWDAELLAILTDIKPKVDSHLEAFGDKYRYYYCNPEYQNASFIKRFSEYVSHQPYAAGIDGHAETRTSILALFDTVPDAQLYLTTTDRRISIGVRIPITKTNKAGLYQVMQYSANPLALLNWPLTAKGEHDPILYGVELEFATDYDARQLVDASDEPFFLLKSDSSVTGMKRNKMELVTVPMSFKAHKKQWAYWFSNLDYTMFDTTKDTNNGMHVHISPEAWVDEKHKQDFAWFFTQPAHQEFMQALSERSSESMRSYSPMPIHSTRDTRLRAYVNNESRCKQNRGAINFSPKGTLEVRLFRGIVSLADVIKNLEFVDAAVNFTSERKIPTKTTLDNFFKWLNQQPRNKYAILKKYFQMNTKLTPHIKAAAILDLVFTETNPDKILEIIKKSRFAITNEHITILNKKFKKRIFILDKSTGEIKLNDTNRSTVSFLDRLVEAKILGKHKKGTVLSVTPLPAPEPEEPYEEEYSFTVTIPHPAPSRPRSSFLDDVNSPDAGF